MPFSARPWMAPRANVALRMPPPEMHSALTGAEDWPVSSLGRMNLRSAATTSSKRRGGSGTFCSNMPADYVREHQPSQYANSRFGKQTVDVTHDPMGKANDKF